MAHIGRNQPCHCGSGRKYKRCHGQLAANEPEKPAPELRAAINQHLRTAEALRAQREKQQGLGRPIVAAKLPKHQIVAVGNRVYFSENWKTFHDFLRDFLFNLLAKEWVQAEQAKAAEDRHRILVWHERAIADARRLGTKNGAIYVAPMTGAIRAFINLAYNIYVIAHHVDRNGDAIVNGYIDRLKSARSDDFTGALFETYAAAAFLKAGFKLEFENERDGSVSHVEFAALYPKTGKRFSVEVKARDHAAAVTGHIDDVKRLRVANKLNKALGKKALHTRIVMIEINVPDLATSYDGWPAAALGQIRHSEASNFPGGESKPSAYVFVTNHAFHNNLAASDVGLQVLAAGFRIADFGPDKPHPSYKGVLESRARHSEMFALLHSMQTHYEIPSTFDGEMPELAFQEPDGVSGLQFGRWYSIPMPDGREVPGRLYDAIVMEEKKQAFGMYQLATGEHIVATCPISDAELAAYRHYPETFFGELRQPTRHAKTLVDWCDFFHESYKDTPREKLLEWMKEAPDIGRLQTLSQQDLAIAVCERWAWNAFNSTADKQASA